MLCEL